jgi:phosphatidate cytidylyltransferase
MSADRDLATLGAGILAVLVAATLLALRRRRRLAALAAGGDAPAALGRLDAQVRAWWVVSAVFLLAVLTGRVGAVVLFALVSFLALREFITMTPTTASDHGVLAWVFFVITPLHYWLVYVGWYGLYSVLIPVYAFLFIPTRNAFAGDRAGFLERTATVQWGVMVCVYCLSHAPALLGLAPRGYQGRPATLLVYLVLVVQVADVLAYAAGRWAGGRKLAPRLSPGATWAGFAASTAGAALVGTLLAWTTPYRPWEAALASGLVGMMGFSGRLTLSAMRRDRGLADAGPFLEGGGGVLRQIDSLCFAAPVFFHVTRYLFGA